MTSDKVSRPINFQLTFILAILLVSLTSCSDMSRPVVIPTVPLYHIQPETWESIDEQILIASISARIKSKIYVREAMDNWLWRVRRRTEDIFIPWFNSYWTQQSMATRVAWHKMQYLEGETTPEEHLAHYLQQEFYEQVLEPISEFIQPYAIMEKATKIYLWEVKKRVEQIPYKYKIPVKELNKYLKFIPAIVVQTTPKQFASLYDVLQIKDLSDLPAYKTLQAQIDTIGGISSPKISKDNLNSIAGRTVTKLVEQLEVRGVSSVASFIAGGHVGLIIAVSAATWNAIEYEQDEQEREAQLRTNLGVILEKMKQELVNDSRGGVTAVVHHMSKQIEYSVFNLDSSGSGLF